MKEGAKRAPGLATKCECGRMQSTLPGTRSFDIFEINGPIAHRCATVRRFFDTSMANTDSLAQFHRSGWARTPGVFVTPVSGRLAWVRTGQPGQEIVRIVSQFKIPIFPRDVIPNQLDIS